MGQNHVVGLIKVFVGSGAEPASAHVLRYTEMHLENEVSHAEVSPLVSPL